MGEEDKSSLFVLATRSTIPTSTVASKGNNEISTELSLLRIWLRPGMCLKNEKKKNKKCLYTPSRT